MKKKTPKAKKTAKPHTRTSSVRGREKPTSGRKQGSASRQVLIGKVSHYFDNIKVAAIKLKAPLKKGDTIRIEGGTTVVKVKIASMQKNHKPVTSAKARDEIGIKVAKKVREGYRAFKV